MAPLHRAPAGQARTRCAQSFSLSRPDLVDKADKPNPNRSQTTPASPPSLVSTRSCRRSDGASGEHGADVNDDLQARNTDGTTFSPLRGSKPTQQSGLTTTGCA